MRRGYIDKGAERQWLKTVVTGKRGSRRPEVRGIEGTARGQETKGQAADCRFPALRARRDFNLRQLQQGLPIYNWPVQPQQVLQLNYKLYHGTEFQCLLRRMNTNNVNAILNGLLKSAKLTEGSDTARQLVPVHQVGMSKLPDTPPSGAPWYANQSTVASSCPFFFSFLPACVTQTVKLFSLMSSTQSTTASWT